MFEGLLRRAFDRIMTGKTAAQRAASEAAFTARAKADREALDRDLGLPADVRVVSLSPRALEMLSEVKRNAEAVREANKPVVRGPLPGSLEWRIQQAKNRTR